MAIQRKMAIVARQVNINDEDTEDVQFWLSKTPAERLEEVNRLRNNYYKGVNGSFPQKIEKVAHQIKYDIRA